MKKLIISLSILLMFLSCQTEQKFDKSKWAEVADLMTFPNRKYMINDLVKNYQLKDKTYKGITELLGQPQSGTIDSTLQIFYSIDEDYGNDIGPVYTKTLFFQFNKDTIVQDFEVREWRK